MGVRYIAAALGTLPSGGGVSALPRARPYTGRRARCRYVEPPPKKLLQTDPKTNNATKNNHPTSHPKTPAKWLLLSPQPAPCLWHYVAL